MNEEEAAAYIKGIQEKFGSDYSLRDVKELAKRAGHPEHSVKAVHIAGTNGKGSVGNYISNILAVSGYTVGRYVSPAVFDDKERIQRISDGGTVCTYFSGEEMAETITFLKGCCEDMISEGFGYPTAFEIETVMAFLLFQAWNVEIAVVECGLGGRLDATNIIAAPLLAVFTSISLDHMKLLGNSILDIAAQKYGIIKKNTIVVSKRQAECETLLRKVCDKKGAKLIFVEEQSIRSGSFSAERTEFFYKNIQYAISQGGTFQLENAAIAAESAGILKRKGFGRITEDTIKEGLWKSRWRGRFEIVSKNPFVLLDGAHNEEAAKSLCHSLKAYFPGQKFSFVIGIFKDKSYRKILSVLLPLAKNLYAAGTYGVRGMSGKELCQCVREMGDIPVSGCEGTRDALKKALAENKDGKIVVCGSLSILKEASEYACFEDRTKN